ncbi:MAG: hypothetical protein KBF71_02900 [Alphaproteobacteria bacterium]|nr:hypothetical protein [Alphaproteobacteria bacterium]
MSFLEGFFRKAHWLAAKQTIIAKNISNASLPHEKALTIDRPNFEKELKKSSNQQKMSAARSPITTNAKHFVGGPGLSAVQGYDTEKQKKPYQITKSGNTINLEEQMLEAADVRMENELVHMQIKEYMNMLKLALNKK